MRRIKFACWRRPGWGSRRSMSPTTSAAFKENNLEVDNKFEDDLANVMAAYARGDIEVDMRTVGEHQGRPRDANTPGIIIGTIDESVGGDGVIADELDQVGRPTSRARRSRPNPTSRRACSCRWS